jgi:alanine racemase
MQESNIITLKSASVKNNIRFLKKKLNSKTKISSVVKANAYGHGIEVIVPLLEAEGIDHFAVFDYKEALRVEKSLQKQQDIMIMGWIGQENIKNAILKGFEILCFQYRAS